MDLYPYANDIIDKFQKLDKIVNGVNGHMKICCLHIGYRENPILKVKFYNTKNNPNASFYLDENKISPLLPTEYQEKTIRFYIKDKHMESIGKYCVKEFEEYLDEYRYQLTKQDAKSLTNKIVIPKPRLSKKEMMKLIIIKK